MPTADQAGSATAPLPVLSAAGFSASVDAYAADPDPDQRQLRIWFLSLLGPQQSLKALWARLLKGELATLSTETLGQARFGGLAPEGARGWHRYMASLSRAGGHQLVLVPESARFTAQRSDFLLLPRRRTDAPALHWRFLNRRVNLPLHSSWADWLLERAELAGEAVALESMGVFAYHCHPNVSALSSAVSSAIRRGVLDVADSQESSDEPF